MSRRRNRNSDDVRDDIVEDMVRVMMDGGRPRRTQGNQAEIIEFLTLLAFAVVATPAVLGIRGFYEVFAALRMAIPILEPWMMHTAVAVASVLWERGYTIEENEQWELINDLEQIMAAADRVNGVDGEHVDPSDQPDPSSGDLSLPDQISDIDTSLGSDIRDITGIVKKRTPQETVLDRLMHREGKKRRAPWTDIISGVTELMREHSTFNKDHCCVDLGHIPFDTKKKAGFSTALTGQPQTVYRDYQVKYRSQLTSADPKTGTLWFFFEPGTVSNTGTNQGLSKNTWTSVSAGMNNVYELDSIFTTLSRTEVTYNKWNITDAGAANSSVQLKNQYMKLECHNPSNDTPCHVDLIVLRCKKAVNAKYGSQVGGTENLNNYMNDAWNKFTGATWSTDSNLRPYQDIFSDNLFLTSHFEVVGGKKFALNYQQSAFMTFSIVKSQIMSFKYKLDSTFQPRDDATNLGLIGFSNVVCRVGEIQFLFNIHGSIPNTSDVDYNGTNLEAVGALPAPAELVMYAHKRYTFEPLELAEVTEKISGDIVISDYTTTF